MLFLFTENCRNKHTPTMSPVSLLFRNDLRTHDHPALNASLASGRPVVAFYFDNPDLQKAHPIGRWVRQGPFQARCRAQALVALKEKLNALGIPFLIFSQSDPAKWAEILVQLKVSDLFMTREYTQNEVKFESDLTRRLQEAQVQLHSFEAKTLLNWEDIHTETGLSLEYLPNVFSRFRKLVQDLPFREPLNEPRLGVQDLSLHSHSAKTSLTALWGEVAESSQTLWSKFEVLAESDESLWHGSELRGREHLRKYIWDTQAVGHYKETRNALMGVDQSSRMSHWLASGALSPKLIASEVRRFEQQCANPTHLQSTEWLIFELLWRDYFIFLAGQLGADLFKGHSTHPRATGTSRESNRRDSQLAEFHTLMQASEVEILERWVNGCTGAPLIDACMRELKATGYMTNRGRQNVASFWSKILGQDWRLGASYFESQLIDYDAAVNWGNWAYVSGQGNDPRDRIFDFVRQSRMYDPNGDFIRKWVPELAHLSADRIHLPQT